MITQIKLPKLGVEMETARLSEWAVAEGDTVASGDVIANVETEKVVFELPSPAAGRIHLRGELDEEYPIGAHLGDIAETDEEYASLVGAGAPPAAAAAAPAPAADGASAPAADAAPVPVAAVAAAVPANGSGAERRATLTAQRRGGEPMATPVARRIAAAHGIDLAAMAGTGRLGAIRRRDVEQAVATAASQPAAPAPAAQPAANGGAPGAVPSTIVKLSSMRRTIATRMQASMQGTAQMTDIREQDVSALVDLRTRSVQRADVLGFRLSYTALFARATVMALQAVPLLNSSLESESELRRWDTINLGMAVAIPDGLLVPVLHGAEHLSIRELNEGLVSLIGKARDRTASAQEMSGGTFTITNFGSFGSHMGTPILLPPQVGILGIGAMLDRPVVRDGELAVGKVVHTCLTVDHRVIDGESAGHFQNELGRLLAEPDLLLFG